ncbi:MAG: hypothetical protein JW757_06885 [Anaerolineales bacterium]|nr:hypothetical protein [Anaerolineales bacterium]
MKPILEYPTISRIRRNHGLEHATIHLLSKAKPGRPLAGHSDAGGFWLLGEVGTQELTETVQQALERMRSGESELAVHPNCGTNFATSGVFAGLAAFLAFAGSGSKLRDKLERLPLAMVFSTLALILTQPLGFKLQREITTSGEPGNLRILRVTRTFLNGRTAHRVETAD